MEDASPTPVFQDSIRSVVDSAPSFPGGEVALRAYLQENMVYPELALEIGSEGKVRVAFVVQPDGHLTDVRVPADEPHPELHQEALRLVKRMPNWMPASVNGSMVAARASVSITFRIRDRTAMNTAYVFRFTQHLITVMVLLIWGPTKAAVRAVHVAGTVANIQSWEIRGYYTAVLVRGGALVS